MNKLLLTLFVLGTFLVSHAQKVGGFYPNWYAESTINDIQWDKLTDVFYAFGQPTNTGGITITNESRLTTLSTNGHVDGTKIHLSFGGAAQHSTGWSNMVANATYRQAFAQNCAQKVIAHDIDGINLDWEFPSGAEAANYADLALKIRAELDAIESTMGRRIELTAAVPPLIWNDEGINSTFIATMDYLYVMAFDDCCCAYCGGTNNHSSFGMAENGFLHWTTGIPGASGSGRGADPSKIVISIPFYDNSGAFYKDFSAADPSGYFNDADGAFGGRYFNSCPLIEQKGDYVMQNGGAGLWTWELVQDRPDQYSLLSCMHNKVYQYGCAAPTPDLGNDQSICGSSSITLNTQVNTAAGRTFTWKRNGSIVVNASATATTYNVTQAGTYTVEITEGSCSTSDQVTISGTLPTPNLEGPYDLCSPSNITLDAGISGTGVSYQWQKNGINISGATSQTYTAYSGGLYNVTVNASGCSSTNGSTTITSSLPTVTHDTLCAAGQATLVASTNVEWYNAENNGSLVFNGNTYLPTIGSNSTYWIQESGVSSQSYTTMRSAYQGDGWQQDPNVYATKFDVLQELTLDQITINAGSSGTVTINIKNATDPTGTNAASKSIPVNGGTNILNLGFILSPGSYYIQAVGSTTQLYTDITAASNFTISNVITVYGNAYWDWSDPRGDGYALSGQYGNYINMKVSTGGSCDRVPAYAIIDPGHSSCTNTPPTADFAVSSTSVCTGTNITFTDNSTGGEPTSWSWNFGAGSSPSTAIGKGPHIVSYSSIGLKTVSLTVSNTYGSSSETKADLINITNSPGAAGFISGLNSLCEGSTQSYSINTVADATSYNWTVPDGATITSGQGSTSITVNFSGAINGTITVTPVNGCGSGGPSVKTVTVNPLPGAAGQITGNDVICFNSSSESFSVANALNATSYLWTTSTGASIISGQGSPSISMNFNGASNGNISITPQNSCGNGPTQNKAITITNAPGSTGSIAGKTTICEGESGIIYSISPVVGASNYNWTVPGSATIVNGQGTTDLTVDFGTMGGSIQVTPQNSCGTGTSSNITVSVSGSAVPVTEGFETTFPATNWTIENGDADVTWSAANVGGSGQSSTSAYMNFRSYSGANQEDAIRTPTLNFTGKSGMQLSFKHAYAWYDRGGTNNDKFDGLRIDISIDCGNSFTTVWSKSGTQLSTIAGGGGQQSVFTPASTQWVNNLIDLSSYDGESSVIIKFIGINGNGNNLYIDDINIDGTTLESPTANFSSSTTSVCTGSLITFSDASIGSPSTWAWDFGVDATPSSATGQGPHAVSYSSPGNKTVSLSVSNALGNDNEVKTNYINVLAAPVAAGSIAGLSSVCEGTTQTYSITSIPGATNYNWTTPTDATISANNGTSITVDFSGASSGSISVTPSNSCGSGALANLGVTVSNSADNAGAISGPSNACINESGLIYSISSVANASSYNWTIPTGATFNSGQGSNTISIDLGSSAGNITVTPISACGNGTNSSLSISITSGAGNAGAITGSTSPCINSSNIAYNIAPVSGASGYSWTLPSGASIANGANSNAITVDFGTTSGNISVTPTSSCGNGTTSSTLVTVMDVPNTVGSISGSSSVCEGSSESYSINAISGATNYLWSVTGGASITSGQGSTSVSIDFTGATNGTIQVTPQNTCGDGNSVIIPTNVSTIPSGAGTISGATNVCENETGITYAISTVSGASSYNWSIPTGATIVQNNGTSITVDFSFNGGNITVTPQNSCGTGDGSSTSIAITSGAADAGVINGPTEICENESGVTYNISSVSGASGYNWTVPSGASIVSGNNSETISVNFTTSGGLISVTPVSSCGNGSNSSIITNLTLLPGAAGAISGLQSICEGNETTYSLSAVANATTYNWSTPGIITNGTGTNLITVDYTSAASGTIQVTPVNICGNGTTSPVLPITVNTPPTNAGTISGSNSVCDNQMGVNYSVPSNVEATGFDWTVPSGATISTGANTNTITVNFGTTPGNIEVSAKNSCGNSPLSSINVAINASVANAGTISGPSQVCANEADVNFSIDAVNNATNYVWSVPSGAVITSNTGTAITVDFGNTGGNVSVTPTNSCGSGSSATKIISINSIPGNAGPISGPLNVCVGEVKSYTISTVSGANAYNWVLPIGASFVAGNGSPTITVDFSGATTDILSVTPSNTCGNGGISSNIITVNSAPTAPSIVSGPVNVCANETALSFTTPSITGATSYNWSTPSGSIISGNGSESIMVNFGTTGGNITVNAANSCGTSANYNHFVSITNGAQDAGIISGNNNVCAGETNITYSIDPVSGASAYNWVIPTGATITSGAGTNTVNINFGNTAGNISVEPTSACGNGASTSLFVNVISAPGAASAITGLNSICEGTSSNYSTTPVTGAQSYKWTTSSGASIISGQGSLTVSVDFTGASNGTISVTPENSCGQGPSSNLSLNINNVPSAAGFISGPENVCENETGVAYSVGVIDGANTYDWALPSGATIVTDNGSDIVVNFSTIGGIISISPSNACGTGAASSKSIAITTGSGNAGSITGPTSVCETQTGIAYSIGAVPGASSYAWSLPNGTSITSGNGTNSILVDFGTQSGNISVTPTSSCGNGLAASLSVVTTKTPDAAGQVTGNSSVCDGDIESYAISAVNGASTYNWTIPSGATITSNNGTSILIDFMGSSSGQISVEPVNTCGNGASSNTNVTVSTKPDPAGLLSGPTNVCENETGAIYTLDPVASATGYNWTIPVDASIVNGNGTETIVVNFGANGGSVSVTPTNSCGSGQSNTVAIQITNGAADAGAISGPTTECANATGITYSIQPVTGASAYNWTVPGDAAIISGSGSSSITVDFGTSDGSISVEPTSSCGNGLSADLTLTLSTPPITSGSINGASAVCDGATELYSVSPIANSSSYQWNVPAGASIISGQGTTNLTVGFSGAQSGNITVTPTNNCGSGLSLTHVVAVSTSPDAAGMITGPSSICENETAVIYSITDVNNASSYNWSVPADATITNGIGSTSITVNFASSDGAVSVEPSNSCGTGSISSLNTTITNGASDAGAITGSQLVCSNTTQITYSIAEATGASNYNWSIPGDAVITAGNNTNVITVNFGTQSGIIQVTPTSSCGNGASSSLNVTVETIPSDAGTINGPSTMCSNSSETFSIPLIANAINYNWTVPSGATITSNSGNSIMIDFNGGTGGNITVTPDFACGIGGSSSMNVSVGSSITTGTISGDNTPCENAFGSTYSVTPVNGALSYLWIVDAGNGQITSGQGSTSIDVDYSSISTGTITVQAENSCGFGPESEISITPITCGIHADFAVDATTFCESGTVTFSNASTGANGKPTYTWDFGTGANPQTITGAGPHSVNYNTPGTYTVSLTVKKGKAEDTETKTDVIQIGSTPTTSSIVGNTTIACDDNNVIYSVNSTTGSIYNWSLTDGVILNGNGTSQVAVDFSGVSNNGQIEVTETNGACVGQSQSLDLNICIITGNTFVSDNLKEVNLFPNPTTNSFSLKGISTVSGYIVEIFNTQGILVEKVDNPGAQYGTNLPAGTYVVKIISEDEIISLPLIKVK